MDTSFSGDGRAESQGLLDTKVYRNNWEEGRSAYVGAVAVQSDGKPVVVATGAITYFGDSSAYHPIYTRNFLARFTSNGSPDVGFGASGRLLGRTGRAWDGVIQNGKVLVSGDIPTNDRDRPDDQREGVRVTRYTI
jgi:hypothetical protein